jgi:hypothetical protein
MNRDFIRSAARDGNDEQCTDRGIMSPGTSMFSEFRKRGNDSTIGHARARNRFDCAHDRVSNGKSRIPDIVGHIAHPRDRPACVDSLMNLSKITQCTE